MHYSNLVIVKPEEGESLEDVVERAMGPSEERGGFWDWYEIGGRWTGVLDGYDPETDPENWESCPICEGTGFRDDELGRKAREEDPSYTCNGCGTWTGAGKWGHGRQGPGKMLKWQLKRYPGDAIPVEALTEEMLGRFYRVVTEWGHYEKEEWRPWGKEGAKFVEKEMPSLEWIKEEFGGYTAVVVDSHC